MLTRTFLVFLVISFSMAVRAQDTLVFNSRFLHNPDTVLVVKPTQFDPSRTYPLVYLLHGYSRDYRQWARLNDLQKTADEYNFILVCPDGFGSWFINSPLDSSSRIEDFFFTELVPKIHQTLKIDTRNISMPADLPVVQQPSIIHCSGRPVCYSINH